jgi:hypothetical protein
MPASWSSEENKDMARNNNGMIRAALLLACAGGLCAPLAGCEQYDPLYRDGMWHPTHFNRANTTLMAANPADLVRGHGVPGSEAKLDVAAIDRLYDGKVKKLPNAGLSDVQVKSQGGEE